jgi:O-antigen/teichoic acid export membrane protein
MGLVGVLGGIWLHVSLPVLVVAIAGAPVFATLLNAIHFFGFVRPDLRPRRDLVFRTVIVQVTKLGGLFFVLQVAAALSISADNFIIARMLGAVNVPEYSIPQRMFGVLSMLFAMFLAPFWPAYGEAVSRGDMGWVRRTLGRSLLRVLPVSFMASALLLLIAPKLIDLWVGHRIHPPFLLLLGLAVLSVFECCRNLLGVFLNGANALRFQVALASSFGLACIVMKVLFIGRWGIVVLPWATILGCLAVEVIPWILFIPRFLRNLEAKPERLPYAQGQFNPSAIAKWGEAGNIPQ